MSKHTTYNLLLYNMLIKKSMSTVSTTQKFSRISVTPVAITHIKHINDQAQEPWQRVYIDQLWSCGTKGYPVIPSFTPRGYFRASN